MFYVGKGCGDRAWSPVSRSAEWAAASSAGYSVDILRGNMHETCALSLEEAVISSVGLHNLTNKRKGGNRNSGWKHTEEAKKRISEAGFGRRMTPEQVVALGGRFRGKKLSDEHKKKLSDAKRGRARPPLSEGTKRKIALAHTGRKHPEWVRVKMSQSSPRLKGVMSPSYDQSIRKFENDDGRIFIGTRGEFIGKFSIASSCASSLVNGKRKSVKGWRIKND